MSQPILSARNWFSQGGQDYARFRPEYPPALAAYLASLAPDTGLAVDVGCGNGQLTRQLGDHFDHVIGLDPSADQIVHAPRHDRIRYLCAPAENLPLDDHCASLITAAQAAHWFDLPAFYQQIRRVAVPGGILALISYGVLTLEPHLNERFLHFYTHEIGPFWPAERKLVDSGYATIDFPFQHLTPAAMHICLDWTLDQFLGYLSTWSAVKRAQEAGRQDVLSAFAQDISDAWQDAHTRRPIQWPLALRIGRL